MSDEYSVEQHYTLGIAGHIDHGKTSLTKALTGKDTDRLKEERERQISIEPGFASFPLTNGKQVGVIDVPGHERFIRQMVAGVAGIDLVLLVVAADEGVMPQTREHLDILNLLGVQKGIIVMTKVDLVDDEFLEMVRETIREETQETFLENSPLLEVDSLSGKGIQRLKETVESFLATVAARPVQGITRLPIDRAFSKKGFGTIVTGTLYQGNIAVGDELQLYPRDVKVKVRRIQVHDQDQSVAFAGQRVALNISDLAVSQIRRGDILATPQALQASQRVDIEYHSLSRLDFALKQRSPIRLHLGTAEVLGRIIYFDRNELQPGETCYAQLELEEPITALFEDRFVIRRPTPMTTIGGGLIIDPYAVKHRFGPQTIERIKAKKEKDLAQRTQQLLNQAGILSLEVLTHQLGVALDDWRKDIPAPGEKGLLLIEEDAKQVKLITLQDVWEHIWKEALNTLQTYHKRYPLREGIERVALQQQFFSHLSKIQWNAVLTKAASERKIKLNKEFVAAYDFEARIKNKDLEYWQQAQNQMRRNPLEVPEWEELLPAEMPEERKKDLLRLLLRREELITLTDGRYLQQQIFQEIVQTLRSKTPQTFTVQDAREVYDTSRKYLIPFLEALDTRGYTKRDGNHRVWIEQDL